jgi:hypothetical protein
MEVLPHQLKTMKVHSINQLKKGQVIRFVPLSEYTTSLRDLPVARIIDIDQEQNTINVEFPDGTKRVIDWIEFIIYILPLLLKRYFSSSGVVH